VYTFLRWHSYTFLRWHSFEVIFSLCSNHPIVCITSGLFLGLPFGFAAALIAGVVATIRALASNGFGLCSGMASTKGSDSLTGWIHQQIQRAAGRKPGDKPVTFGDLWTAPAYTGETLLTERMIDLKVVTTGLTEGRPFTIPFLEGALYFNKAELEAILPRDVLQSLIESGEKAEERANPPTPNEEPRGNQRPVVSPLDNKTPLTRLPDNADLPILVATRMSLSFPGLLSAVPLYRVDYRIDRNQNPDAGPTRVGTKVWFSDGGICSNFPLNFFDSPLPRWPTFGLNLLQAPSASCQDGSPRNPSDFVKLPKAVGVGPVVWNWLGDAYRGSDEEFVEERSPKSCLGRFVGSIMNTMQNWRDNLQAASPGYRDRIVSVELCQDEGGLNLNMPEELIKSLNQRGDKAAELLLTDFDFLSTFIHAFSNYALLAAGTPYKLRQSQYRSSAPRFRRLDLYRGYSRSAALRLALPKHTVKSGESDPRSARSHQTLERSSQRGRGFLR
jgi:hypothetical protein